MTQVISQPHQFVFQAQELLQKLDQEVHYSGTGYWRHQFSHLSGREKPIYWYVAVAKGRFLYSGNDLWTADALLRAVQRYLPRTRQESAQHQLG
ncbi:MAG TPA: hypothetical protein V6D19_25175, partial [Stenomitos sp.]